MTDPIFDLLQQESDRQASTIPLIPSENFCSAAVREAVGSVATNKYAEGYPGRRYYEGNEVIDQIELLAIDRAKQVFKVPHANVQPYSGSPANSAVQMALMKPGETMLGFALAAGGHLTHGHPKVTFSGNFFHSVQYGLDANNKIDYAQVRTLALEHMPKVIYCGLTAYPFAIEWSTFAQIAEEVGAYLVADIAHIAGLVAAEVVESPVPFVHVVTTTTHKTLRGPRGAMILVTQKGLDKDVQLAQKIDKAVFPGLQGGPHNNVTAGIAVALHEAMQPEYKTYAKRVLDNAKTLANSLLAQQINVVGNGTENHLMIMDFREFGGGTQVALAMAMAGLVANKNTVPNEPNSPFYPSGVRLGTPAVTTLGMGEAEMHKIADWIGRVVGLVKEDVLPTEVAQRAPFIESLRKKYLGLAELRTIKHEVAELRKRFPAF